MKVKNLVNKVSGGQRAGITNGKLVKLNSLLQGSNPDLQKIRKEVETLLSEPFVKACRENTEDSRFSSFLKWRKERYIANYKKQKGAGPSDNAIKVFETDDKKAAVSLFSRQDKDMRVFLWNTIVKLLGHCVDQNSSNEGNFDSLWQSNVNKLMSYVDNEDFSLGEAACCLHSLICLLEDKRKKPLIVFLIKN